MISIIVPVYNEEEVLPKFIESFFKSFKLNEKYELIFINDGSRDKTKDIITSGMKKHKEIRMQSYGVNKGLGNALTVGIKSAKGRIIITMDSDLAHPPSFIPKMVEEIDEGYDVVIGSRYMGSGGIEGVPYHKHVLSRLANCFTKIVMFSRLNDLTSGLRAYNSHLVKRIKTKEIGFEVELEILAKLIKGGAKIIEIPFKSTDRAAGISKFSVFVDGPRYILGLLKIIRYRWL